MKKELMELSTKVTDFAKQNEPAILTGMRVAGLFMTALMAYKASPRAHEIIERHQTNVQNGADKKEETKQLVKEVVPVVLPTVGMAVATSAAIIGAHTVNSKRIAVLSAAYSMSESALKDYQEKMLEVLDEKKVSKIKESISQDKIDKKNIDTTNLNSQDVIITGDGDVLCMDNYSGRLFRSNAQKIGQAVNELSADLQTDMYVSLNDFYDKLGLASVPMGDDFGWNIDDLVRGQLDISVTACLTKDKQPCLMILYDVSPREDFRRLH